MGNDIKVVVFQGKALQDLKDRTAEQLYGKTEPGHCVSCKQPFSKLNVYTEAGWRETKISGMCECCWDNLFNVKE